MDKTYDGMKILSGRPYEYVYMPEHPLAHIDGTIAVHILQAEKKLGRYLKRTECVHHIDEDKKNNAPNNLMVFVSISSHSTFHSCLKNGYNYRLTCMDGVFNCIRLDENEKPMTRTCNICGKPISYTSSNGICIDCYNEKNHEQGRSPEKQVLIDVLKEHKNFVKVGKLYGVSDNAVRKWCKYYELPTHSSYWKNIDK